MSRAHEPTSGPEALRIGDWLLVPSAHTLQREGQVHRLPKRLVELLLHLASRPGETWTREALLESAWSRKLVNDEVLSRAVADLRGYLGDDAREPRYIETLPKTGYRLIAPVAPVVRRDGETRVAARHDALDGDAAPVNAGPSVRRSRRRNLVLLAALLSLGVLAWLISARTHGPARVSTPFPEHDWSAERMLGQRPFRSAADWAHQPRYSRDGRWLAYAVIDLASGDSALWWGRADGVAPRRLDAGSGRLAAPVFSPDGTRIAYTAWDGDACRVRVLDLPAGAPRDVAECAGSRSHPLDWITPQRLLYSAPPAAPGRGIGIAWIDPELGAGGVLSDPPAVAVADSHPREAGDGRIAFLRGPDGQRELWLWENGRERRLLDGAHRIPDLAWTPGADGLLLASDRDGFPGLGWLDLRSGALRPLGARGAATLDVAPDGRLLYEQRRYDANLWLYAEDGEPRRLTDSTRYEAFAALDAAGERLLYVSNRDGNGSIWMQALDSTEAMRLDLPSAETWVRPQWLDARHVALTRYEAGGTTSTQVFDLAAQRVVPGHPLAGPGFAAVPAGPGRLLLGIGHGDTDGMQLRLRGANGEHELADAAHVAEFRSDGRWAGWVRRGSDSVELQVLEGEAQSGPRHALPLDGAAGWSLHDGVLFTARRDDAGWAIWRQRLADGEAQRWLPLRAAPADGQLAVTADGRRAVLSHLDGFAADLLLVPPIQSTGSQAPSRE